MKTPPQQQENISSSRTPFFNNSRETPFFSKTPHNPFFTVQPKLKVGAPNDPAELEADSIANEIANSTSKSKYNTSEVIQPVHSIQRKPNPTNLSFSDNGVSQGVEEGINNSKGNGFPLPTDEKQTMENALGSSLEQVRIHDDNRSAEMNQQLGARAFTVGNDIFFDKGEYLPNSKDGNKLLAHELVHTIQQKNTPKLIQPQLRITSTRVPPYRESRYTITLGDQHLELWESQIHDVYQRLLRTAFQELSLRSSAITDFHNRVRLGRQGSTRRGAGNDQPEERSAVREGWNFFTAIVSETTGGVTFPWHAFDAAHEHFRQSTRAVSDGNYELATQELNLLERAINRGVRTWNQFIEGAQGGAESTAEALETFSLVSLLIVSTVATGGIATAIEGSAGVAAVAGATGLSTETVAVVSAGAIAQGTRATVEEGSRELGEFATSGDVEIEWGNISGRIISAAALGALTPAVSRYLTRFIEMQIFTHPRFVRLFGEVIERAGTRIPMNLYWRYLEANGDAILGRIGAELLLNPIRVIAGSLSNEQELTFETFNERYSELLISRGFAQVIANLVVRGMSG